MSKMPDTTGMTTGGLLDWMGTNSHRWAHAFTQRPPVGDRGSLVWWFASAIMAGYAGANSRTADDVVQAAIAWRADGEKPVMTTPSELALWEATGKHTRQDRTEV